VLARAVPGGASGATLMPVPLHPLRRRLRGYNQAAVLARAAGASLDVPCADDALVRWRWTPAQTRRGAAARRANVADAFRLRQPDAWRERSVLVVDDVMTTGATMEACLDVLAAAGARARGLVLAWAQ